MRTGRGVKAGGCGGASEELTSIVLAGSGGSDGGGSPVNQSFREEGTEPQRVEQLPEPNVGARLFLLQPPKPASPHMQSSS